MAFSTSDIIAGIALIVSCFSVFYTRLQSKYARITYRRSTLDTLSYFTVQADGAINDTAKYLYICFALHAFSQFSSWGWEHRDLH